MKLLPEVGWPWRVSTKNGIDSRQSQYFFNQLLVNNITSRWKTQAGGRRRVFATLADGVEKGKKLTRHPPPQKSAINKKL